MNEIKVYDVVQEQSLHAFNNRKKYSTHFIGNFTPVRPVPILDQSRF